MQNSSLGHTLGSVPESNGKYFSAHSYASLLPSDREERGTYSPPGSDREVGTDPARGARHVCTAPCRTARENECKPVGSIFIFLFAVNFYIFQFQIEINLKYLNMQL